MNEGSQLMAQLRPGADGEKARKILENLANLHGPCDGFGRAAIEWLTRHQGISLTPEQEEDILRYFTFDGEGQFSYRDKILDEATEHLVYRVEVGLMLDSDSQYLTDT